MEHEGSMAEKFGICTALGHLNLFFYFFHIKVFYIGVIKLNFLLQQDILIRLHNLLGQLIPVFSHPHSKKAFPDIQIDSPMFQFVPNDSGPVIGTTGTALGLFFALSFQIFVCIDKIPCKPYFLHANQLQLSQPFSNMRC